jgi:hypothetical protein
MERERRRRGILPGVGGEEEALEGAAQRRSQTVEAALCGGGAAVREVRKGGARGGEEVFLPLYRAEGGRGKGAQGGGRLRPAGLTGARQRSSNSSIRPCFRARKKPYTKLGSQGTQPWAQGGTSGYG